MTNIHTGKWAGNPRGDRPDLTRCRAAVPDGGRSALFHQCNFKAVVKREVDGKTYGFCKLHDPVAVEAKNKERQAKYDAEWKKKTDRWEREEKRLKACDDFLKSMLKSLRLIRDGNNDPRALARDLLAKYETFEEET